MNDNRKFNVGDVVVLKSGSPLMTVTEVSTVEGKDRVEARYFTETDYSADDLVTIDLPAACFVIGDADGDGGGETVPATNVVQLGGEPDLKVA